MEIALLFLRIAIRKHKTVSRFVLLITQTITFLRMVELQQRFYVRLKYWANLLKFIFIEDLKIAILNVIQIDQHIAKPIKLSQVYKIKRKTFEWSIL